MNEFFAFGHRHFKSSLYSNNYVIEIEYPKKKKEKKKEKRKKKEKKKEKKRKKKKEKKKKKKEKRKKKITETNIKKLPYR